MTKLEQWTAWLRAGDKTLAAELASAVAVCDDLDQAAWLLRVPVAWLREWVEHEKVVEVRT